MKYEAPLQRVLLAKLSVMPEVAQVWRNNVGQCVDKRHNVIRYGLCVGSADLIGLLANGRFLAIECKSDSGDHGPDQKAFQAAVERLGGLYILAREIQPTLELVRAAAIAADW